MSVWKNVWLDQSKAGSRKIFSHRLFLDAYPVIKKYLSGGEESILEVGAGSGRFGLALARDFPKIQVTITDLLPESISMVTKLSEELGLRNVVSQQEDVLKLSFPDNSFDVVLAEALIQHLKSPENALAEMVRVLKPNGKLIVSAINWWNPHTIYKWWRSKRDGYEYGYEKSYTRAGLKRLLEPAFVTVENVDGFSVGYGLYRLKNYHQLWAWLGRVTNRSAKIIDIFTNRWATKFFAFQLIAIGRKNQN